MPFTVSNAAITDSVIESGAAAKDGASTVPIAFDRGGWLTVNAGKLDRAAVRGAVDDADDARRAAAGRRGGVAIDRRRRACAGLRAPYRLKLTFDPAAASGGEP